MKYQTREGRDAAVRAYHQPRLIPPIYLFAQVQTAWGSATFILSRDAATNASPLDHIFSAAREQHSLLSFIPTRYLFIARAAARGRPHTGGLLVTICYWASTILRAEGM